MGKHLIKNGTAVVVIFLLLCSPICASGHKATELERVMAEISSLQHGLSDKIAQAKEKREQLTQKIEELKTEIQQEKDQQQIETYLKAVRNTRIGYNLKLIQLLLGYITGLSEKIMYLQNGHETLVFYSHQIKDDLMMIKTLNDLEIDKLIAQINLVLDEYTPETGKPMFDVNETPLEDTEKIWDEIIQSHQNQ